MADTAIDVSPSPESLANMAVETAKVARMMGHEPRVALLSFSNFGNPLHETTRKIREAVAILDNQNVDFEYEGEMTADVALNEDLQKLYPFSRLSGTANVLIAPDLHSSHISSKLLVELGGGFIIGPVLVGMSKSAQIVPMNSSTSDILNTAALAASITSLD